MKKETACKVGAIWIIVTYTEYFENIPDPTEVGLENRATPLATQMTQLATAVAAYFAAGHVPVGTLPGHPHILADVPLYPETADIELFDGLLEKVGKQYKTFVESGIESH